jgi:hypothetical protein
MLIGHRLPRLPGGLYVEGLGAAVASRDKGRWIMFKKTLMAAVVAAFISVFAASAAFAGETTGNYGTDHGKNNKQTPIGQPGDTDPPHAASICSFSGQNPERFLPEMIVDPDTGLMVPNPEFEPGRTQSWGQIPKQFRPAGENPGVSCNGHTGFFAGGGSE